MRYVISDPSTFLYFDRRRPVNDDNSNYNYQYIADESRKAGLHDDGLEIITCTDSKCDLNYDNPTVLYNPYVLKPQSFAIPHESWNTWQVDLLINILLCMYFESNVFFICYLNIL